MHALPRAGAVYSFGCTKQSCALCPMGAMTPSSGSFAEDVWHVRFDCAQTEIAFLQKRLAQLEERLSAELSSRSGLEQKASIRGGSCWMWGSGSHSQAHTPKLVFLAQQWCWGSFLGLHQKCRCSLLGKLSDFCWLENKYPEVSFSSKSPFCSLTRPNSALARCEREHRVESCGVCSGSALGLGDREGCWHDLPC